MLTIQVTVMEELELPTDAVASTLVGGKGAGEEWYVGVWCVDVGEGMVWGWLVCVCCL